ncbi:MAG: response regulator [Methanobacterium sp. ERen5]|nr:MAG: response regulator [Methanobacterium sp. ERen5]
MKNSLEKENYNVLAIVTNGEDAIKFSEENKPDLVIMDIKLEGKLDGVDAAQIIESKLGIPIIYLTSYSDKNTMERVKSTHPSAFIVKEPFEFLHKPFEENELYTAIDIILYQNKGVPESYNLKGHYKLLESVLKSVSEGAIATDLKGRIIFMNPVAENFAEISNESFIGTSVGKLIPDIDLNDIIGRFNSTEVIEENFSIKSKGNDYIPIECTFNPIVNESDRLDGVMIMFRQMI